MRGYLRKGISPIIATALLILIAIATGLLIYSFATGWIGGRALSTTGPSAVLVIETADANATGNTLTLYVRNDGGSAVNLTRIYLTNEEGATVLIPLNETNIIDDATTGGNNDSILQPGEVAKVYVNLSEISEEIGREIKLKAGYTYKVVLVASDGSEASIAVRAHK